MRRTAQLTIDPQATGNIANEAMQYLFVWDYVGVSMMAAEAMTAADTANRQQRAYIYMAGSIALIGAVLMLRRLRRRLLLRRDVEGGGNTTALLSCVGHNSRAHNL